MTPDWHPLQEELKLWLADELALPLWWRDDDTISVTPQLEQLTALSGTLGCPSIWQSSRKALKPNLRPICPPSLH